MLSFEGATDNYYRQAIGSELMQQIYKARKAVYTEDLIRAVIFVVITASLLWASSLQKLKSNIVYIIILLDH